VPDSRYARRITARTTPMRLSGPAAGDELLQTAADPTGTGVVGMINNCAGGITPWGTVLTAEENFHGYFWSGQEKPAVSDRQARYGLPGKWYDWGRHDARFDLDRHPNEANRFGWIVEIDPYDPTSVPVKRTALGRFAHEGAAVAIAPDGRAVAYSGDDARFEYLYKFVSRDRFDPADRTGNLRLLDAGTLFVARFEADGRLAWLPLVWGTGPLTAANGFRNQADVLVHARAAGDVLGATRMDRPEDVETSPATGKTYVCLTNNTRRKPEQVDAANPRADNAFGHVLEITPENGDHAAQGATWEMLVKAGDPKAAESGAWYHPETSADGWFASPDNLALDRDGRLWIATDQGEAWPKTGTADGLWGVETEGPRRGLSRMFFRVPVGAELCGPVFTPDATTLFVAVQHPAADGARDYGPFGRDSTYEDPATRWPDFDPGMPVRPAVVAITKRGGGVIGR
jgi:secreted PhoX family phosphatase